MPLIRRNLGATLRAAARANPVATITGPRQSGKTTLCRSVFRRLRYVSLEPLDNRRFAREDPRGFLDEYSQGAVIDEVQHAPALLSYIQEAVDDDPRPGRFVLTGSQDMGLMKAVSQSLAGRTAVLHLFPPTYDELRRFDAPPDDLWTTLWMGAYPRIHDRRISPRRWLADYVTTYVQQDVRNALRVGDLEAFTTFVRLCAARTACEVNLSSLGSDVGVSYNTIRSWISVLEASFLCLRAPAWRRSERKQLVKAPKLHFLDSGLTCHLLGINEPDQLRHHPLRGQIFESWVASEIYKARAHRGLPSDLYHFRDSKGLEIDILADRGTALVAIEVKSAATVVPSFLAPLERFATSAVGSRPIDRVVVFGGEQGRRYSGTRIVSWRRLHELGWS